MINEDPPYFSCEAWLIWFLIVIKDYKISSCQCERIFFYSNMTPELSADSNVNHFISRDEFSGYYIVLNMRVF